MRTSKLAPWLVALSLASAPALAAAEPARDAPAPTETVRRPAAADELARYAEREEQARPLEQFEGGRRGGTEATTIVIILLVVILVVLLV